VIIQDQRQKQGTGVAASGNIMSDIDRIKQLAGIDEGRPSGQMDDPSYRPIGTGARLSPETRSKLQQVYKIATAKGDQNLKTLKKGGGATIDNLVSFLANAYLEKNVNIPDAGTMTPPMPLDSFINDS
jgi:hypothetical protein